MKYHTSIHSIPFEHKYKVGDKVWLADRGDDKILSGEIQTVSYDPDNGNVIYFIEEYGKFGEEWLFPTKNVLIDKIIERTKWHLEICSQNHAMRAESVERARKEMVKLRREISTLEKQKTN